MTDPAPETARDDERKIVSAARTIDAPAAEIFELLARPARHAEIDGSEMVQKTRPNGPERLSHGAKFGMDMKFAGFLPYRISNEVVEFEEGRRIAWRHFGKHIWRYELEPIDETTTRVTESFEWGTSLAPFVYELVGYPKQHVGNMERTLVRLDETLTR